MKSLPIRILLGVLLIIAPYTALIGINEDQAKLRTWRIVATLLVVLIPFVCRWKMPMSGRWSLGALSIFWAYICLQPLFFERQTLATDAVFVGSVAVVTALMPLMILLAANRLKFVFQCLSISITLVCLYQYWQIAAWEFLGKEWASILNDRTQVPLIGFYRVVAGFFGAPGFMGEAGQMALFIGPGAGILLLARHLGIYPSNRLVLSMVVISLAMTLSIGGAIQLAMLLGLQYWVVSRRGVRLSRRMLWMGGASAITVGIIVFASLYPEVVQFFVSRWTSINDNTSERQFGALLFWELFAMNPWFGYGFTSYEAIRAQPSHFVTILTDHGIIGGVLLMAVWLVPLAKTLWRSKHRIFLVPYGVACFHMLLAYGSYQWPGLWMNLGIALYCIELGTQAHTAAMPARRQRPAYRGPFKWPQPQAAHIR